MRLFKRRGAQDASVDDLLEVEPTPTLPEPPAVDGLGRRLVAEQCDYLLSLISPLPAFGMYLLDAWGTAVCEEITADTNLPVCDTVAADGYAVRAEDLVGIEPGTTLRVRQDDEVVKPGSAVPVRTGQQMPQGADAVVPADRTSLDGNALAVRGPVSKGDQVRLAGSEVRIGVPIIRSGERLDARRSALLALAGIDRVLARPRPRVVVLSLARRAGEPADVSAHLIAAASKSDGAQVWRVNLAADSDRELHEAIGDQLIRADLVIAAGVLDGDAMLPRVVASMGLIDLAEVALDPCSRIGFALVGEDQIPLVMLPDDPVAVYVGYQFFVHPLIRKLMGAPVVNREKVSCLAGARLPGGRGTLQVRFGTVHEQHGEQVVVPIGRPESPRLADLVAAGAMILLDEDCDSAAVGERVGCWLLDD